MKKTYLEEIIKSMDLNDIEGTAQKAVNLLYERKITYKDCLLILGHLGLEKPRNMGEWMFSSIKDIKIRKVLKIKDIKKMNFLETTHFITKQLLNGIEEKDLEKEFRTMWEEGIINGFDYRYIIEAMNLEVKADFLKHADQIGRYNK